MIKAPIRGKRVSDGMHSLEVRCWWFVLRVGTQGIPGTRVLIGSVMAPQLHQNLLPSGPLQTGNRSC